MRYFIIAFIFISSLSAFTLKFNNPTPYESISVLRSATTLNTAPTPLKREQKIDLLESLELECN